MTTPDPECPFCGPKIVPDVVTGGEYARVIRDRSPRAAIHLLVVPVRHVARLDELSAPELADLIRVAHRTAVEHGLAGGYRLQANVGKLQHVKHLHLHLQGAR